MTYQFSSSDRKLDKILSPEQFEQVVEAILAGKYSWACLLILRFAGYNPLHYIPYRTFNRLMKENSRKQKCHETPEKSAQTEIKDLDHLEPVCAQWNKVRGGNSYLSSNIESYLNQLLYSWQYVEEM